MGTGNWSLLRLTGAMPHGPFQPTLMGLSRVTAGYESYCGTGPVQGRIAQAGLPDLTYPLQDRDVLVTACGAHLHAPKEDQYLDRACRSAAWHQGGRRGHLARQLHELRSLGFIDLDQKTLQPIDNPFGPRLSPMS
jgi:hypothetical protein